MSSSSCIKLKARKRWRGDRVEGEKPETGSVCTRLVLWVFHGGPPGGAAGWALCVSAVPGGFSAAAGSVGSVDEGQGGGYPGFPLR